ncbi:hypothetical protein ACVWW7_003869 [Bradyrhizobium sp. LM6.9]
MATRRSWACRRSQVRPWRSRCSNHKRGPKVIAFKKRRRKNSRRKRGYRDEITVLRISEILTDGAKPTKGPRPKREKVVKPETTTEDADAA